MNAFGIIPKAFFVVLKFKTFSFSAINILKEKHKQNITSIIITKKNIQLSTQPHNAMQNVQQ